MGRLINEDNVISSICSFCDRWDCDCNCSKVQEIRKIPPAQRNGTWMTDVNDNNNAYCSECGLLTTKDLLKRIALVGENKPKFCPNCGAKMEDKGR